MSLKWLDQGSSITFSQGPKASKLGMVAGHRYETQLEKNTIYCHKSNIFSVDIEQKHLIKAYARQLIFIIFVNYIFP